jgi:cobalamin synthase
MPNDSHPASSPRVEEEPVQKLKHLLWFCPFVGLLAGGSILWLYGFTYWAVLAFVFVAACPLVIVWVLMIERSQRPASGGRP